MEIKMPKMAITTSSSMSVKPRAGFNRDCQFPNVVVIFLYSDRFFLAVKTACASPENTHGH
jgi:hypothetical protein